MNNQIIFYCGYQPQHFGDIHLCKGYITNIIKQLKKENIKILYLVNCDTHIVNMKNICIEKMKDDNCIYNYGDNKIDIRNNYQNFYDIKNNILLINTWAGHYGMTGGKNGNHNFSNQMNMWKFICDNINLIFSLNINIDENIFNNIPEIEDDLLKYYNFPKGKKIFFANSTPLSNQSEMGNLKKTIEYLSNKYQDVNFICTEYINYEKNNIFYTDDLTKRKEYNYNSLPETAKIAEQCDIIVTNCSGPGTFLFTKNILKDKNKKILCFVSSEQHALWNGVNDVFSKNIWSNTNDELKICDLIDFEIKNMSNKNV